MIPIQDIYKSKMQARAIDTAQATIDKLVQFECRRKLDDIHVEEGSFRFYNYAMGMNQLLDKNVDLVKPVDILIQTLSKYRDSFVTVKKPNFSGELEYNLLALDDENNLLNLELDVDADDRFQGYSIFFRANNSQNKFLPEQPTLISKNAIHKDYLVSFHPTNLQHFNKVAQQFIKNMKEKGLRIIDAENF